MAQVAKKSAKPFRYLNPWSADPVGRPEYFEAFVKPIDYRGFQIVHRFANSHELVKNGVCLTQRAGRNGPKNLADALLGDASDDCPYNVERARKIAADHGITFTEVHTSMARVAA